jgi:hypothetical protein
MGAGVSETMARGRDIPAAVIVAGNTVVGRREGVPAGEVPAKPATKVTPATHGVPAAEMSAAAAGNVPATAAGNVPATAAGSVPATAATASAATAVLRQSQSRRSRNRHAERQGADGSHDISRGRFDHHLPPRFQAGELTLRGRSAH